MSDVKDLIKVHAEARQHRKALEAELTALPVQIEQAIIAGDTAKITELSRRRRDVHFELQEASALENAHCRADLNARVRAAGDQCTEALNAVQDSEARELEFDLETRKLIEQREQGKAELHAETEKLQTELQHASNEMDRMVNQIRTSNTRASEEMAKLSTAA